MRINEIKTEGYWIYAHITPDGLFYIGVSQMQPYERWKPRLYKGTALEPYIEKFGWSNIRHFIFKDGLTREQAYQLEDLLIQEATENGYCINQQRSGLIEVSDKNAYNKRLYSDSEQYREKCKARRKRHYAQHREEIRASEKQRNSTPEGKIYNRVASYNQTHVPIETPLEAKQKYLENGYIPNYIKHDDL